MSMIVEINIALSPCSRHDDGDGGGGDGVDEIPLTTASHQRAPPPDPGAAAPVLPLLRPFVILPPAAT